MLLAVEDDGPGLAEGASATGTGVGGRLIKAMANSLKCEALYDSGPAGVRVQLRLPAG